MKITQTLKIALKMGASDVILSSGSKAAIKINGEIMYIGDDNLEKNFLEKEILSILNQKQKEKINNEKELDLSIELKGHCRFRLNLFFSKTGISAVFRPIKDKIPNLEELKIPKKLIELSNKKNGLIIITGPSGSGKSTTMAFLIEYISKNFKKHIITVEDPIEFIFKSYDSIVDQREVGLNTKSFENALKYSLRQASDVIMIGEMRDLDTFRLALRAAETGNLVISTLHTSGSARAINRIIDMFPGEEKDFIRAQLSESLLAVVSQDLIKRKDGEGRVLATELMINNTSISNMIRKSLIHQINGAIETGRSDGMYTMDMCLDKLRQKGYID